MKRALVLQGGGAKGAFSFGCIKSLNEHITFEAVAGTSVGALNATLLSSQALAVGDKLWGELSEQTTFPSRLWIVPYLPSSVRSALLIVWMLAHNLILYRKCFTDSILPSATRHLFNAFVYTDIAFVALAFSFPFMFGSPVVFLVWFALCVIISFTLGPIVFVAILPDVYSEFGHLRRYVGIVIIGSTWIACFHGIDQSTTWLMLLCPWMLPLFILSIVELYTARSSSLLESSIKSIVDKVNMRTYVTVCSPYLIKDYDKNGNELPDTERVTFLPLYKELLGLDQDIFRFFLPSSKQWLLASASLPLGIVPPVVHYGQVLVDGGVRDNIPILPILLREPDIDEIWIVLVSTDFCKDYRPDADPAKNEAVLINAIWEHAAKIYPMTLHTIDLEPFSGNFPIMLSNIVPGPIKHPKDHGIILNKRPELRVIYPQSSLGGFFNGTLNFTTSYARGLIEEGALAASKKMIETGIKRACHT